VYRQFAGVIANYKKLKKCKGPLPDDSDYASDKHIRSTPGVTLTKSNLQQTESKTVALRTGKTCLIMSQTSTFYTNHGKFGMANWKSFANKSFEAHFANSPMSRPLFLAWQRVFVVFGMYSAHSFRNSDLPKLKKLLAEAAQGLHPLVPSAIAVPIWHLNFAHIPEIVEQWGALRGVWMFCFERFLSTLSRMVQAHYKPTEQYTNTYIDKCNLQAMFGSDKRYVKHMLIYESLMSNSAKYEAKRLKELFRFTAPIAVDLNYVSFPKRVHSHLVFAPNNNAHSHHSVFDGILSIYVALNPSLYSLVLLFCQDHPGFQNQWRQCARITTDADEGSVLFNKWRATAKVPLFPTQFTASIYTDNVKIGYKHMATLDFETTKKAKILGRSKIVRRATGAFFSIPECILDMYGRIIEGTWRSSTDFTGLFSENTNAEKLFGTQGKMRYGRVLYYMDVSSSCNNDDHDMRLAGVQMLKPSAMVFSHTSQLYTLCTKADRVDHTVQVLFAKHTGHQIHAWNDRLLNDVIDLTNIHARPHTATNSYIWHLVNECDIRLHRFPP
jgi:hypothetical protein